MYVYIDFFWGGEVLKSQFLVYVMYKSHLSSQRETFRKHFSNVTDFSQCHSIFAVLKSLYRAILRICAF